MALSPVGLKYILSSGNCVHIINMVNAVHQCSDVQGVGNDHLVLAIFTAFGVVVVMQSDIP